MTKRTVIKLLVAVAAVLAVAVAAYGFYSSTGTGTASGSVGDMSAPSLTAPSSSAGPVSLSWTAATVTPSGHDSDVTYTVARDSGSGFTAAGGTCAGTLTSATLDCSETLGTSGSYVYKVTAHFGSWTSHDSKTVAVDTVAPTVQSSVRADSNNTNASTVSWTVTFSESVSGVDATDFALTTSGVTGASVGTVTPVSGSVYTVTAGTGSGTGTIRLDLTDDNSITDGAGNALGGPTAGDGSFTTGQAYAIDKTAPQTLATGNDANWHNADVTVHLAASDTGGSGVATVHYTVDSGTQQNISGDNTDVTINAPSNHSNDGTHTIAFWSTDGAGNSESPHGSATVKIDTTGPDFGSPALTLSESDAFTHVSGTQVFYNPQSTNSGSFTVSAANVADAQSGLQKVNFPSLTGMTGGGDDSSSPYSSTYSWTSSSGAAGSQTVTAYNTATGTSTSSFTATADTTAPSVPTPTVTGGFYTTTSVPVALGSATDGGSGVSAASIVVQRDDVGTTNGSCDAFPGTTTTVTLSSGNDTTVQSGHCYRYRELESDNVGNQGTSSNSNVARVDTTNPVFGGTPLSISTTGPNTFASGSTVYYNPQGTNAGSFDVTANVSDAQSGIQKVAFPALSNMSGGGDDSTSPYVGSYSWTSSSDDNTGHNVTATNNAGLTANTTLTVTKDVTGPTTPTPSSPAAGYFTTASVPVAATAATDGGSGIASSGFEREQGDLASGSCDFSGATWQPVTLSSGNDTTVTTAHCYQYRQVATDHVGNANQSGASGIAKVDLNNPTGTITAPAAGTIGGTVSVDSSDAADTGGSGVASVKFQERQGAASFADIAAADTSSPYSVSWDTTTVANGNHDIRAIVTDAAGRTFTTPTVTVTVSNAFTVSATTPQTAGTAFSVTITAVKGSPSSTNTDYSGTKPVVFTGPASSPSGTAPTYPANVSFTNGVGTASVTLVKAETATLTATVGNLTGGQSITVNAASPTRFAWSGPPTSTGTLSNPCFFTCTSTSMANNGTFTAKVTSTDAQGNASNVAANTTVNLTRSSTSGNGTLSVASVQINSGSSQSATSFTFTGPTGSWSNTITAAQTGFTSATVNVSK